jgi:hypothetical protein
VHPLSKVVVLIFAMGMAMSSYCAQVCSIPQLKVPECPQHHQSDSTNCCEQSSVCSLGIRSAGLIFLPVQTDNTSAMLRHVFAVLEKYEPPDSVIHYALQVTPSVLRV